ncbi:serine protease, partial [Bacteroidales bacterium OttesenSCG-928-L03]|nr:serine protease [Bacteroidales bacterium OttesenSCG-928-L03]
MKHFSLFVCLCLTVFPFLLQAEETIIYRLSLTDKGESGYSVDRPEDFLSTKSIQRRTVQGFPIDETDLPISPTYFSAIHSLGARILAHSKWVNTITVLLPPDLSIEE